MSNLLKKSACPDDKFDKSTCVVNNISKSLIDSKSKRPKHKPETSNQLKIDASDPHKPKRLS